MRLAAWSWGTVILLVAPGSAQQAAPRGHQAAAATGAVAGHVYCSDTNLPARIASVTLQTINVEPEPVAGGKSEPAVALHSYQTSLDGSFFIPQVRPGTYYVVTQMPGYLSPVTQFSYAELQQPTPELLVKVMKIVPVITVEAHHTAALEIRLERGAAIMGTIRYDDGAPVASMNVTALVKETKDKKESWVSRRQGSSTDDQGHYRITGLPPGEYLPQVDLSRSEIYVTSVLGATGGSSSSTKYSLEFYLGDTSQRSKARSLKIASGEQMDGSDLTIPVSKLHSVTGTVSVGVGGHVVNGGTLVLAYDDGTQLASTEVDKDDGMFHFDFVPEGTYTLSVSEAKDVARKEVFNPPGSLPPYRTEETTVKEFGKQSQPLVVQSDMTGVVVVVPEKNGKVAGAQ